MRNKKTKIFHFSAYLVLLGLLSINIADLFHYHRLDLLSSKSNFAYQSQNNSKHFNSEDNAEFCPIHYAFYSIQNTILANKNPFNVYQKQSSDIVVQLVFPKPCKNFYTDYSLRAPPFFS